MQIPKNIEIKDATGRRVAFLSPKSDGLKDCSPDIRLNGESTLEFSLPSTSEKLGEITPECQIWAGGRVYGLLKDDAVDTVRDGNNKQWSKFMAVERWAELDTSYVEPSISNDPTARPPSDLSITIVGGGSNLSGELYATGTAGHALYAVLQGSGWTLGICDVTGIRDLENEKSSRLATIKQIQDIWGGYLVWDSVNRIVHLRDAGKWQNYTGFQVRYRKNLKHITRTQSNKLVTKLYPFGHDDLDIANVNGGKKFITNNTYTSREYVGIYKNQDIYDQSELLEKAIAELELICRPRHLYKVKLVDVRVLPEYSHETYSLGDMADIIDPDIAPDSPRPRIIRHRYNLFRPWDCELDIGDPEERLIEQLNASFGTSDFIDGKFNGNGQMSGHSIEYDTIVARHIRTGSIEIGHLDEGVVPGLNLLENPVFSSYAESTDEKFGTQATLIQQNAEQISLQAVDIDGLGADIARLDVRADEISSSVADTRDYVDTSISTVNDTISQVETTITNQISSINQRADSIELNVSNVSETVAQNYNALDGKITSLSTTVTQNHSSINQRADSIVTSVTAVDSRVTNTYNALTGEIEDVAYDVSRHESSVTQLANQITSKVSYTDYNGREIATLINQEAHRITISAEAIDLTGVTTIYDGSSNRNYAVFDYGDFAIINNNIQRFVVGVNSYGSGIYLHDRMLISIAYGEAYFQTPITLEYPNPTGNGQGYNITSYYESSRCYIDASVSGIVVRDRNGNQLGSLFF